VRAGAWHQKRKTCYRSAVTWLALLAFGFLLGLRHATDADHVVAVTTLVSRERSSRAALLLGAAWGLGHTLTLVAVGGAIVFFGIVIPPRLGLSLEMSVALMLILLGAANLRSGGARAISQAIVAADGGVGWVARLTGLARRGARSLLVGVVHGLAGSAAVALLVLASVGRQHSAAAYLAVFGVGTVAGMLLLTAVLSLPLKLAAARFASAERLLARTTGAVSLAFGLFLAYRIGFVDGLLLDAAGWTPQ
jgi:hypothetical protein